MSPDDPRDPSIEDAYRAAAREEPPRDLDERILAAAHRAVDARPSPVRRSFAQRWRVPVAIAATLLLSATVTLMVYESDQTTLLKKRGALDKMQEESVPPAAPTGATGAARESAAPAAAGALRESRPSEAEGSSANEAKRKAAAPPAEPARLGAPAAAQAPQSGGAQRSLMEKREAAAPAPTPAPSLSRDRELADRPAGRTERDVAPEPAQPRLQSPDDWLAEIRRLKQAGRIDAANRLLAEFRASFPDHPLPEDLR